MAMSTQMNAPSTQLPGLERARTRGPAALPGFGRTTEERPGFADMLHEASSDLQAPRRNGGLRPAARQDQQRRGPSAADQHESLETDHSARDRMTAERVDQQQDEAADDADAALAPDEETSAAAAAAAEVVQPLATQLIDEEAEGDGELLVEDATVFQAVAERGDGASDGRSARAQVVPSNPSIALTTADKGPVLAGFQSAGQGTDGNAMELFSAQEYADADVQVEAKGGQIMERLQQALAANHVEDLDELGKPVVPQVVRSIAALTRNGVSEMRLQLQPGDLGEIELRVRAVDGMIRGEVMVQHAEVKNLLDSQIERLRAALEAQGLRLEGLEVGVSDDGAFARDSADDGEANGFAFSGRLRPEVDNSETVNPSAVPRRPIQLSDDAVDWLV